MAYLCLLYKRTPARIEELVKFWKQSGHNIMPDDSEAALRQRLAEEFHLSSFTVLREHIPVDDQARDCLRFHSDRSLIITRVVKINHIGTNAENPLDCETVLVV